MCLRLLEGFKSEKEAIKCFKNPLIAKRGFKVYKVLTSIKYNNGVVIKGDSFFRWFVYEKGYQYSNSEFTMYTMKEEGNTSLHISEGLHAYTTYKTARYLTTSNNVIEMWVPKGAKYFIGNNDDIVTNELIWY